MLSSLSRDTLEVKRKTLLSLMDIFSQFNEACQQHVLSAFFYNIPDIRVKAPVEVRTADYSFITNEASKSAFLEFATDVFLWTPRAPRTLPSIGGGGVNAAVNVDATESGTISPGHSENSQNALKSTPLAAIQNQLPDAPNIIPQIGSYALHQLSFRKVHLIGFLKENIDLFTDLDLYVLSVIAATDSLNDVQHAGDDLHRKLSSKEALEDISTLKTLFHLFLGEGLSPFAPYDADDTRPNLRTPVSLNTRLRILELISRSRTAPGIIPRSFMVLFSGIFASHNKKYVKVQQLALVWAQQMVRFMPDDDFKTYGPALLSAVFTYSQRLKKEAGTSNPYNISASQLETLQIAVLHVISAVGRRAPAVFSKEIHMIESLMEDLLEANSVVLTSSLQETLSSICPSSSILNEASQTRLKAILAKNFEIIKASNSNAMQVDTQSATPDPHSKTSIAARYISQFYANRCFPFSDDFCRYLNLLGTSDANAQVAQEAKLGLKPFSVVENEVVPLKSEKDTSKSSKSSAMQVDNVEASANIEWPSFSRMVKLINEKITGGLVMSSTTFQSTITFLHNLLRHHRFLGSTKIDSDSLAFYFNLLQDAIVNNPSNNTGYLAAEQYLETMQFEATSNGPSPADSIDASSALDAIPPVVLSGSFKPDSAKIVSRIVGLLALRDHAKLVSLLDSSYSTLLANKSATARDIQIGCIYTMASITATCLRLDIPLGGSEKRLEEICSALLSVLQTASATKTSGVLAGNTLILACLESIGLIGRWSNAVASVKSEANQETLLQSVLSLLTSHDFTIVITTAYCVGNLCLGDRKLIADENVLKSLLATFVVKNEEAHFSIGEALSMVAYGWFAPVSTDSMVVSTEQEEKARSKQAAEENAEVEAGAMKHILRVTLQEYFLSSRPDTRMASAIWLLTIVKNCGAHSEVKSQLRSIQVGFQQLLGDSNEILQEVAGKALSLVYELGDETTKKELVESLVNALQKGSASTFKVTADSEIFAPGAVGTTPTGDKLTTYRELVTLASEMNQPDLIYKFMQLSSHNALWNSKKGAAFATGELARRAKEQIEPHLPQLVPKLYRNSFDPNPKIAHSMHSILETLVPDLKAALQTHIHEILKDLLHNCVDPQWRTREASCNALADILAAREWNDVKDELKDLWERCFRVLDDIKESVRKAAEGYKKALSTLTLRLCDPSYTNRDHGRVALEIALPHLMSKGLLSPVKEVRAISLSMLQKIAKVASFLLKPHIAELVPVLLTSLGSLENSAQLNYLEQHSNSLGISGDVFDEVRVSMSKGSPVHATIDTCVQQVDSQNIELLGPKVAALLTSDYHVATRTAAANVIATLALTKPEITRLIAHKLMLALKKGINARAPVVRKTYGYAMGQLSRCAKKRTIEIVVTSMLDSYKQSTPEEGDLRAAIAESLLELSKASAIPIAPTATSSTSETASISTATGSSASMDVDSGIASSSVTAPTTPPSSATSPEAAPKSASATSYAVTEGKAAVPVLAPLLPVVVPVVFIARFDAREDTSKIFNKIWEECGASLALYVSETVAAFATAFESSSWQMKQQGAKAVAKFAESLNLSQFVKQAPELLKLLLTGLKGRTWQGKESLLDALAKLVSCTIEMWAKPSDYPSNTTSADELFKVISGEVSRKTLEYKKAAIVCLTDVLNAFNKSVPEYPAIEKVKDLLIEHATTVHVSEGGAAADSSSSDAATSNSSGISSEKKDEETALSRSIRQMSIQALCAGFPSANKSLQLSIFGTIVNVLKRTFRDTIQYTMKVSVLNYLKTLVSKIKSDDWDDVVKPEELNDIFEYILLPALADPKYSIVRTAACNSLTELLTQAEHSSELEKHISKIDAAVTAADQLGQTPVSSERLLALVARIKSM